MKTSRRALPILFYAGLLAAVVLSAFLVYGSLTYDEFKRVQQDVERSSLDAAKLEVKNSMHDILAQARENALAFANWEEVQQQLQVPQYYPYWRNHRMLHPQILPKHVLDAEIYGPDGKALAQRVTPRLPLQLTLPLPPPYVQYEQDTPYLLVFQSIRNSADNSQARGYVALLVSFLEQVRNTRNYHYAAPESLRFPAPSDASIAWTDFVNNTHFSLRDNPMSAAVENIVTSALRNLSIILGLFVLLLLPFVVYLVVRPLQSISRHVDRLKEHPGGLILDRLPGMLPVVETENIRASLNDYQRRLLDVHSSLEQKNHELWTLAHQDVLTGAHNRRAFDEHMHQVPQLVKPDSKGICFALFDVNHFKPINDSYGHEVGDEVLKIISHELKTVLREDEELFRIGGDEFAAILLDCDELRGQKIAKRCQRQVASARFDELGIREPLKISIGLAVAHHDMEQTVRDLPWQADIAMYYAKRPGNSSITVYQPEMASENKSLFSNWINAAVYDAITRNKGLTMFYQPIVDLSSGSISHYESLVRILHEDEWIMPGNIFPLVEARRLEAELDRSILQQILVDLANDLIPEGTGVAVNLSGPSVVNDQLMEWLAPFRPYLSRYKVVLEVTETALITQMAVASENLAHLQQQGFEIALDDFGSGYSSVRYLASMPVDTVKFDISLIRGLDNRQQHTIVDHLARMITESGYKLVAEGIENDDTLGSVRSLGFGYGQGYHFGRPEEQPEIRQFSLPHASPGAGLSGDDAG